MEHFVISELLQSQHQVVSSVIVGIPCEKGHTKLFVQGATKTIGVVITTNHGHIVKPSWKLAVETVCPTLQLKKMSLRFKQFLHFFLSAIPSLVIPQPAFKDAMDCFVHLFDNQLIY
jgi:hypothetical protein